MGKGSIKGLLIPFVDGVQIPWQSAMASLDYFDHPARELATPKEIQDYSQQEAPSAWVMEVIAVMVNET